MTLLKINNFNTGILPTSNYLAVGIDLGTTNSLVATVLNGKAQTLADNKGRHLMPSVVHYKENGCIVGYDAYDNTVKDPTNTIRSVKRMIGLSFKDIQQRYPNLPYRFQSNKNGSPMIATKGGLFNPISISAEILKTLVKRAKEILQGDLDGAVITVPAYFDDSQRQSTKDAANLAGLNVLRLLNEPTAAAIAYGLNLGKEGVIAVYDLGGGTFDISILRISQGVFEVLSTGGNTALGGDDFDYLLADFICKKADIFTTENKFAHYNLLNKAIAAKIALSSIQNVTVNVDKWQAKISRDQFNNLISPLVKRTIFHCRQALKDARVKTEEILEVVMVGGSTRIPLVRKYVSEFFGRIPLTTIDPDKTVAIGAAIQADILVGNKSKNEILLLDVTPLSLGIETIGGLMEKIIPRNTTIPTIRTYEFTTFKDGQTAIFIHILQGERELASDCRSLARFSLRGLPALSAGMVHIFVTFQIDADGILSVTAAEKSTGIKASIQVKPSYGLTDNEVTAMIQDSINYNKQDIQVRMLIEKKIEAEGILEKLDDVLVTDAILFDPTERLKIENAVVELRIAVESNDINAIKKSIFNINKQIQDFATHRINQPSRRSLKGSILDKI